MKTDPKSPDVGGFTFGEITRIAKCVKSNHATVRRYIRQWGLQGMTTKYVIQFMRMY